MSLIRYNSALNDFTPTTFNHLIDRFFNESLSRTGGSAYSFVPRVDVVETEKAYEIHVSVPGISKDEIKIDVNDNLLAISGERKFTKEKTENHFRSIETQYGTFNRSFALPENVDATKIDAKYVDGILEINVPKDEKKVLKASIKVN